MNPLIIAGGVMAGLIVLFVIWLFYKRAKKKNKIPETILNDFNYLEEKMIQSRGTANPHTLMWNLRKLKGGIEYGRTNTYKVSEGDSTIRTGTGNAEVTAGKPDANEPTMDRWNGREQGIQNQTDTVNRQDGRIINATKQNTSRFAKIFRRKK